ncbi:hypothetical protein DYD21_10200 [Rhodohalobacter sp. SW132]|uniref:hypothetical protein n=1 Tax=Rhodohalobacter sp. SW132 TaxID=2293433 RepID=UPI000E249A33|nr:hypothetical protein [Rhodohalobacter sp. SW132]REL33768.1 hypothetical protein DYD21_10200 [Rhodohalobacter sp. SW132]
MNNPDIHNLFSRKKFLQLTGTTLGAGLVFVPYRQGDATGDKQKIRRKPQWIIDLISLNDTRFGNLPQMLKNGRVNDTSDPDFGGFLDGYGLPSVNSTSGFISRAICSITLPESQYYESEELMQIVREAANYLVRVQHEDGTIDLLNHNFYSPPDTAFRVRGLTPGFKLLRTKNNIPGAEETLEALQTFLQKASDALVDGGVHTPNHRWIMCDALGRINELWPNERYLDRANRWLTEGIDIDEDGQYRERDTVGYSAHTNRALVMTSKFFDKPELLDYVRKNLDMTLYYITSNGQVVEEVSERVERDGRRMLSLSNQYYSYRYLALRDDNQTYSAACRHIERNHFNQLTGDLKYFLEDPDLWSPLPPSGSLPRNYEKEFRGSGVVRVRRGNYDASIISRYTKKGIFFAFHKGDAILWGMRLGNSFSGMGQFESDDIRKENGAWVLERKTEGFYVQPVPEEKTPIGNNWNFDPEFYDTYGLMWHTEHRERTRVHPLIQRAVIREIEGGFEVEVSAQGTDNVPTTVELIFRPEGVFTGVDRHEQLEDTYFLKNGFGSYRAGGSTITFGPGTYLHSNADLRGTLPKMDLPTVVLTGITPFQHKIRIT